MHKHDAHRAVGGDYRPDGMREQGFEEGGNVGLLRTVQGRRDRVGVESVRAQLFVFSLSLSLLLLGLFRKYFDFVVLILSFPLYCFVFACKK